MNIRTKERIFVLVMSLAAGVCLALAVMMKDVIFAIGGLLMALAVIIVVIKSIGNPT